MWVLRGGLCGSLMGGSGVYVCTVTVCVCVAVNVAALGLCVGLQGDAHHSPLFTGRNHSQSPPQGQWRRVYSWCHVHCTQVFRGSQGLHGPVWNLMVMWFKSLFSLLTTLGPPYAAPTGLCFRLEGKPWASPQVCPRLQAPPSRGPKGVTLRPQEA